ncbi:MAG: glucoamylase [Methanophagales archaeon ANME-1-THS]|nr:MAG: glucoamylase [Methanophagales archaeon ANME-1-THS]
MNQSKARRLYERSIALIKENQHPNGGFYASPPGTRYAYIYPRDHSVIVLGALSADLIQEARLGLQFILDAQKPNGEFSQRYDVDGVDRSYKELQIDSTGLVLFALGKYHERTEDDAFIAEYWEKIQKSVTFILHNKNDEIDLIHTINSIHEYPAYEHGFEIYANSACCSGILKAVQMGNAVGRANEVSDREKEAKKVRESILTRLWSPFLRSFIKTIRIKSIDSKPLGYDPFSSVVTDPDASEYAPAYFELIEDSDWRVISTVKRLNAELWDPNLGGLNRYPEYWDRNNGGYGPWPHFTAQLVRHFLKIDDRDMAEKYLGWCVEIAHNDELPEHIAPLMNFMVWEENYKRVGILRDDKVRLVEQIKKHGKWEEGLAYSVVPLLWPHAEYICRYNDYKRKYL